MDGPCREVDDGAVSENGIPLQNPQNHSLEGTMAKAQDAKKETKKKPEKTLKEKRIEKQAKKATKG